MPHARLLIFSLVLAPAVATPQSPWLNYGSGSQHRANFNALTQPYEGVRWSTPVDLDPQYSGESLLIHYGSPLATRNNMIIVTVKTQAAPVFEIHGHRSSDGALMWIMPTDYVPPASGWTPSCGSALDDQGRATTLYTPAIGGTVLSRFNADLKVSLVRRLVFFGAENYELDPAVYNQNIKINTPITCDKKGNIYFGFIAYGPTPAGLVSGLAKISNRGVGTWISAAAACGDPSAGKVATNCAPALSQTEDTVYFGVNGGALGGSGYLVGVSAYDLHPRFSRFLLDPYTHLPAQLFDSGTSSPTIGPDGDVYYGVLENPFGTHHVRGWLLHFDSLLRREKAPGGFGWDDTGSIVPASCVPQYTGTSKYLILTKYNNYAGIGGDGVNRLAVLDPNDTQFDMVIPSVLSMKEILTIPSPTPDDGARQNGFPNAVREWCINTAAVDVPGKCAHVNCEDGTVYKWDFPTNTLAASVLIAEPTFEAYTPTIIAPDGTIYAINDAVLNAVGRMPE